MSYTAPLAVTQALSAIKFATGDAIGNIHALHYHWDKLSECERSINIGTARTAIEEALAAIIRAENAIKADGMNATDHALSAVAAAIGLGEIPDPDAVCNVVRIGDHSPEYARTVEAVRREMGAA